MAQVMKKETRGIKQEVWAQSLVWVRVVDLQPWGQDGSYALEEEGGPPHTLTQRTCGPGECVCVERGGGPSPHTDPEDLQPRRDRERERERECHPAAAGPSSFFQRFLDSRLTVCVCVCLCVYV